MKRPINRPISPKIFQIAWDKFSQVYAYKAEIDDGNPLFSFFVKSTLKSLGQKDITDNTVKKYVEFARREYEEWEGAKWYKLLA